MAATDGAPLRAWSLATFHAISFVVIGATLAHRADSLREAIGRLDTGSGGALFLVLWTLTFVATRTALRQMPPIGTGPVASFVFRMAMAGGWNGVGVFAILVAYSLVSGFASRGLAAVAFLPVQLLTAVIGTLLAFTIGVVVGMFYGLIDALMVGCGEWLYRVSSASISA